MTDQPLISVRGEAVLQVDPEIAIVSVAISARDRDRHRALELLARRGDEIAALARSHGEAVEKVEGGSAHVHPELKEGKPRERIAGYVARSQYALTVRDFSVLGELVGSVAEQEMTTVNGPWWSLRPDSPVYRKARLKAAREAIERAREYAEAFGGTLSGLVEVADTGLLGDSPPETLAAAAPMATRWMGAEPDPVTFNFEPVAQTVRASVEARFTMTSPDLTSPDQPSPDLTSPHPRR